MPASIRKTLSIRLKLQSCRDVVICRGADRRWAEDGWRAAASRRAVGVVICRSRRIAEQRKPPLK